MANKVYILIIILLTAGIFAYIGWGETKNTKQTDLQITQTPYTIQESLERVKASAEKQNLSVIAEVEIPSGAPESENAENASNRAYLLLLNLPEAGELIEGNIQAADMLPLKIILWQENGKTNIAFTNPEIAAEHYNLPPQKTEAIKLKLNKITEEASK